MRTRITVFQKMIIPYSAGIEFRRQNLVAEAGIGSYDIPGMIQRME